MINLSLFEQEELDLIDELMEQALSSLFNDDNLSISNMRYKTSCFTIEETNLSLKERLDTFKRLPLEYTEDFSCLPYNVENATEDYLVSFFDNIIKCLINEQIDELAQFIKDTEQDMKECYIQEENNNLHTVLDSFEFAGTRLLFNPKF